MTDSKICQSQIFTMTPPKFFRGPSSSSKTMGWTEKGLGYKKLLDILYLHTKFRRDHLTPSDTSSEAICL